MSQKPVKLSFKVYENVAPLLMFHGLYGSKSNFNTPAKHFHEKTKPRRRVLTVDVRNHGLSEQAPDHTYQGIAEDIKLLFSRLGIKKAALFGHSMGGKSVLYFSLKYPEMVERLIVSDICHVTNLGVEEVKSTLEIMKNVKMPAKVTLGQALKIVDKELSVEITNRWFRSFLLSNVRRRDDGIFYWRVNIDALMKNIEEVVGFPDVSGITYAGHVLYLAGTESDFIKKSDLPHIKKLCPKAEIKFIEGAGHLIHVDEPEQFQNTCLEFLNRNLS